MERNIANFYEEMMKNKDLRSELAKINEYKVVRDGREKNLRKIIEEKVIPIANKNGVKITTNELLNFILKPNVDELDLNKLAQVSGGASIKQFMATGGLLALLLSPISNFTTNITMAAGSSQASTDATGENTENNTEDAEESAKSAKGEVASTEGVSQALTDAAKKSTKDKTEYEKESKGVTKDEASSSKKSDIMSEKEYFSSTTPTPIPSSPPPPVIKLKSHIPSTSTDSFSADGGSSSSISSISGLSRSSIDREDSDEESVVEYPEPTTAKVSLEGDPSSSEASSSSDSYVELEEDIIYRVNNFSPDSLGVFANLSSEDEFVIKDCKVLGKGAYGTTYLVEFKEIPNEKFALKVFDREWNAIKDCEKEWNTGKLITTIESPHICHYLGRGLQEGTPCIVMEYCNGVTLEKFEGELYKKSSKDREKFIKIVVYQLLSALRDLHGANIFHRDIKPENIIIFFDKTKKTVIKLIDYGLSKHTEGKLFDSAGSPLYAAPEVFNPKGGYDGGKADVFSVGRTTLVLACGDSKTYNDYLNGLQKSGGSIGEKDIDKIEKSYSEGRTFEGYKMKTFSPALDDFITKCLALNPDERLTADQALQHPWFAGI